MEKLRLNKNETLTPVGYCDGMSTPEQAIKFLLKTKEMHKGDSHYNHFLICNLFNETLFQKTIKLCEKYNLKYINIATDKDFNKSDLFKDDNEYDIVFNNSESLGLMMRLINIYCVKEK